MTEELKAFLGEELAGIWADGERLVARAPEDLHDYAYLVFPFAKSYEGFLKKLFFKMGAINEHQYDSQRWRVGRALNPQLEEVYRKEESVYDRILENCGGKEVPEQLWEMWRKGRNQIFHYFPGKHRPITLQEAKEIISGIELAMTRAIDGCNIK